MEEQGRRQERGQKFLHLQKEMCVVGFSLCWPLIYSLTGYILFQLLKEWVWCKPPDNLLRRSSVDVSSFLLDPVFGPFIHPLMNKRSGSSHHDLDNKWGRELLIIQTSKTSQRRCFFAVPVLSHSFWPGAPIKTSRLDRTSDHCSIQRSAQADQN